MVNAVWEDLIGQESLVSRCKAMVASGRVPHALIISAPAGAGKSTLAEILTRALLCAHENAPCGICSNCQKVLHGNHPDVVRIGISGKNTVVSKSVEQIISELAVKPYEGGRRIVILEDAHAMSLAAQNKLLKSLEEPPEASILLLLCDTLSSLLPTIISRCAMLRMCRVPTRDLAQLLVNRLGMMTMRAQVIANLSDGWVGRAMQMARDDSIWQIREEAFAVLRYLSSPGGIFLAYQHVTPLRARWPQLISFWQTILRDCLLEDASLFIHKDHAKDLAALRSRYHDGALRRKCASLIRAEYDLAQNANPSLVMDSLLLDLMAAE